MNTIPTKTCIGNYFRVNSIGMVVLLFSLLGSGPSLAAGPAVIYYTGTDFVVDKKNSYHIALLDLVLRKSRKQYALQPNRQKMVTARVWQQLETEQGINVIWGVTTPELERRLLPVRIALDKGILGWRLLMIKSRDRQLFAKIQTLDQLKLLLAGQQSDWGDTAVLRANGLAVLGVADATNLYPMLVADRFHYYPRGVGEIWQELNSNAVLGLEVEQHLALHYPIACYFFVSKNNPELARQIEVGLRSAIRDGSLNKLFDQYNGAAIKRANFSNRLVFELRNPLMDSGAQ